MAVASSIKLGGVTLPSPKEQTYRRFYRGGVLMMANGAIVTDLVDNTPRHKFHLSFTYCTQAELDTITTQWDAIKNATATYTNIRNVNFTVTQPDNADMSVTPVVTAGGDIKYNIELDLEETI